MESLRKIGEIFAELLSVRHDNKDRKNPKQADSIGYCGKVGRKNGAMEYPYGGTHNGTYNAVILEKGERSQAVRSYTEVTRGDVKAPLRQNRLIMS